jgi:uncharacterized protein (TIGR03382 family)
VIPTTADATSGSCDVAQPLLLSGAVKHAILLAFLVACMDGSPDRTGFESTSELEQQATVCGKGPTVKGIDVSVYQGTINWAQVKADGVVYALVRVSDGLNTIDSKFAANWSGSRNAGVLHGAYQFFRPSQDPIAQADLLLSKIGTLQADDLPPVIDVEAADGLAPATVASKVKMWVNHVKQAIGRDPIVYTGFYFWRDSVGNLDLSASPLWHAQYTTAACPNINSPPWTTWHFWQYTSTGRVTGISGNVDVNRWNGTKEDLMAFLGPPGTCGDEACSAGETKISCPADCGPCGTIAATGGVVDDGDECFVGGGPPMSLRHVTTDGMDGDLVWTHTTSDASEANFGEWHFNFVEAGRYQVEAYTSAAFAQSKQAVYVVHASDGPHEVTVDQSATDGYQSLGEFDFDAGSEQFVHLADNTGEALAGNVQLVFDAIRVTRIDDGIGSGSDEMPETPSDAGGCNTSGSGTGLSFALLALLGIRRRRR